MSHRFTLDVPSFQKLLAAAWVLQCERDLALSESDDGLNALALSSGTDELNAPLPPTSAGNVFEPARAVAAGYTPQIEILYPSVDPAIDPIIDPSFHPSIAPIPSTVAPTHQQTDVAGALALAADLDSSPLPDPVPPDSFRKPARRTSESAVAQISRRALTLVPFRNRDRGRNRNNKDNENENGAFTFQHASRVTAAYAGPVVVLLIMLAFLSSLLGIHPPTLTAVKAAPLLPKVVSDKTEVDKIAADNLTVDKIAPDPIAPDKIAPDAIASDKIAQDKIASVTIASDKIAVPALPASDHAGQPQSPAPEPPVPEASHLRVTDPAASSLVAGLSRYEMQTVRQQAQYGDAAAALTLGMAYEIGRNVPRSCTQAAHWVAVAAEDGNSAAQYNLALRYISGDGTPANLDEARKWLEKAATHGYQKARLTLQTSHL